MRKYPLPAGPLIDANGIPTQIGRAYLSEIQARTERVNNITNLDVSASTADVRAKLIELITALQG